MADVNHAINAGSAEGRGAALFRAKGCGGCHTINGYTAGRSAPTSRTS